MKIILFLIILIANISSFADENLISPEFQKILESVDIKSEEIVLMEKNNSKYSIELSEMGYFVLYGFMTLLSYLIILKKGNVDRIPDGAVIAFVPAIFWPIMMVLLGIVLLKESYMNKYVYCQGGCDIKLEDINLSRHYRDPHFAKCDCCKREFFYDNFGDCYEDYFRNHRLREGDLNTMEFIKYKTSIE